MTARREKGKFLVFRVFAEMCIGSQSARGMAMFAEPLPRIISGSRGLVYPRTGGLRGFSICRLRVNRTSDSSPSGEYSRRWLYLYHGLASNSAWRPLTVVCDKSLRREGTSLVPVLPIYYIQYFLYFRISSQVRYRSQICGL